MIKWGTILSRSGSDEIVFPIIKDYVVKQGKVTTNSAGLSWFIYHDFLMLGWSHSAHPCEDYITGLGRIAAKCIILWDLNRVGSRGSCTVPTRVGNSHKPLCGIQGFHPWQICVRICPRRSGGWFPFLRDRGGSPVRRKRWAESVQRGRINAEPGIKWELSAVVAEQAIFWLIKKHVFFSLSV